MNSATKKQNIFSASQFNKLIFNVAVIAILVWAWRGAEMNPSLLVQDAGNMWILLNDFLPPDVT
jgi:phosphonate transport system permease protein